MLISELIEENLLLARARDVEVRFELGEGQSSGYCRFRNRTIVILNPLDDPVDQLRSLLDALAEPVRNVASFR